MNIDNALHDAIKAANEFKYFLDIQPKGKCFHPSGLDARNTDAYKSACDLLAKAVIDGDKSRERPRQMLFFAVPVGDVISKDGADAPTSTLNVFSEMARVVGIQFTYEDIDGTEHRSFLEFS